MPVQSTPTDANEELVKVTRVIDGDTIQIDTGRKVRLIGIDTPEAVDPRQPAQCFGKEASLKTTELLQGNFVLLEKDVSEVDRYGRLLRYVYKDGVFINQLLVSEGYAHASSYPPDIKYQDVLRLAEQDARANNRGLWGACTSSSTSPQPTSTTSSTATGDYVCDCSKSCSKISSCTEAQYQLTTCGCKARDGDSDGIACDGAPLHCQQ